MSWTFVILGVVALLVLFFILHRFWFWRLDRKEIRDTKKLVKELTESNTPKLAKEEQFNYIDGKCDWTRIQTILGMPEIPIAGSEYFIDIEPDEYLEHLKKNNPPASWGDGSYGWAEIKMLESGYEIIYYDHGNEISTKLFDDYEQVLRYLVYYRLTNIAHKYKKLLKKDYYK